MLLSFFQKSSMILWAIGVFWGTKRNKASFELIHYSALSLSLLILAAITLLYFAHSSGFDQLTSKNYDRLKDFLGFIFDL
jgi:NADH:ubiquinone oxidoreductase subunit 4 (subunit M)